jgi:hypothetical protein
MDLSSTSWFLLPNFSHKYKFLVSLPVFCYHYQMPECPQLLFPPYFLPTCNSPCSGILFRCSCYTFPVGSSYLVYFRFVSFFFSTASSFSFRKNLFLTFFCHIQFPSYLEGTLIPFPSQFFSMNRSRLVFNPWIPSESNLHIPTWKPTPGHWPPFRI